MKTRVTGAPVDLCKEGGRALVSKDTVVGRRITGTLILGQDIDSRKPPGLLGISTVGKCLPRSGAFDCTGPLIAVTAKVDIHIIAGIRDVGYFDGGSHPSVINIAIHQLIVPGSSSIVGVPSPVGGPGHLCSGGSPITVNQRSRGQPKEIGCVTDGSTVCAVPIGLGYIWVTRHLIGC